MVHPGCHLVGAVERQAYPAAVLASRMARGELAPAPIWDDLASFDGRRWRGCVDIVTAGYPCQPESLAGKRRGAADERWLWHEVWRVTREVGARYLFVENVVGHLSGTFERVLGDLAASGWAAEWDCVPAAAVGAPHLRDRLFLLAAHPDVLGLRVEPERDQRTRGRGGAAEREPAVTSDGRSERSTRGGGPPASAAGAGGERRQADPGQRDVGQLRHAAAGARAASTPPGAADADLPGRPKRCDGDQLDAGVGAPRRRNAGRRRRPREGHAGPGTDLSLAARAELVRIVAAGRESWRWDRAPEPVVRRVDDGPGDELAEVDRAERLYALGNAVVPQAAAYALTVLWDRLSNYG